MTTLLNLFDFKEKGLLVESSCSVLVFLEMKRVCNIPFVVGLSEQNLDER